MMVMRGQILVQEVVRFNTSAQSKKKKIILGVLLEGQATDCIQSKLQIKPHNAVKVISQIIGSIPIYVANL